MKIVVVHISLLVALEVIYLVSMYIWSISTDQTEETNAIITYTILLQLAINLKLSVVSLMAYQSLCVTESLRQITEKFQSFSQIDSILRQILELQDQMKNFDQMFNDYTFVLCITNTFRFIVCVCALYFKVELYVATKIRIAVESIIMILLVCQASNLLNRQYSKLLRKLERIELCEPINSIDHTIINRMYYIKDDLCFTVWDLYKINAKTILSLFSLIITYSVIFIQTQ